MLSPAQSPDAVKPLEDRWDLPPASEKPAWWRRWGVSLAVAVLLHAVLAAVLVLAWRKFAPLNPPGPVMVELAPPQGQPSAEPAEPTFATNSAGAERSDALERAEIDHPFAKFTPKSEVADGTGEPTFAPRPWEPIAPVERADENAAGARTASGGAGVSPAPSAGMSGPIDTRIAPSSGPRAFGPRPFGLQAKKPPRKLARSLNPLIGENKQAGPQGPSRRLGALPGSIVINAIGARVEDRVRAAIARANASGNAARNAVGNNMTTNAGNAAANAAEGVVINAIGMAVHVHPGISPSPNGAAGSAATASAGARVPGAGSNGGVVNGTSMGRVATRAGTIGGATKSVSGALNGTDFGPRHP